MTNAPQHAAPDALRGASVVVGVTGGVAAYKTATLVSRLSQAGATATVLMTDAATKFVSPLTFQALSAQPVYTSQWAHIDAKDPQHIALARGCDCMIVAPCTMDCMARLAHGFTDDVVTLVASAIDRRATPVLLAPSMNETMWGQPSTQRNAETLRADGFELIGPEAGWQACRTVGAGRMTEPEALVEAVARAIVRSRAAEA